MGISVASLNFLNGFKRNSEQFATDSKTWQRSFSHYIAMATSLWRFWQSVASSAMRQ
jgi:hypothetical protein